MKVVLTTYVDAQLGVEIDQEARALNVSRSDYIARILADVSARKRTRQQIERELKKECVAAK